MPTNRPNEDKYSAAGGLSNGEVEALVKSRPSVIEKLTAPPETLEEHAVRLGYTVDEHYWARTGPVNGEATWEERMRLSRPSDEPAKPILMPEGWEIR